MLKRCISSLLVTTLLVAQALPIQAYANTIPIGSIDINILEESIGADYWFEISEFQGTYYYFRDTEEYTITMEHNPERGLLSIWRRDKASDIVTYEIIDLVSISGMSLNMRSGLDFNNVPEVFRHAEQLLQMGHLSLDSVLDVEISIYEFEEFHRHSYADEFEGIASLNASEYELIAPLNAVTNSRVISALNRAGHRARGFTRTQSLTQSGLTSSIYENTTFRTVETRFIHVPRHLAVSAVALLISKPVGIVAVLFELVLFSDGLVTAMATNPLQHRILVSYIRQGRVNGIILLAPFRDLEYYVTLGSDFGEAGGRRWDSPSHNFHNQPFILQEALRLFRLNVRH